MKIRSATEVTQSTNFLPHCLVECYSTNSEEGKPCNRHSLKKDLGHSVVHSETEQMSTAM